MVYLAQIFESKKNQSKIGFFLFIFINLAFEFVISHLS